MTRFTRLAGIAGAAGLAAYLLAASPAALAAPAVGQPAPDIQAVDTNGNPVNLSDYRGRVVLLEWTNRDCPFVRKHYDTDNMQNLQRSTGEQDAVWLTIISSAEGEQGYLTAEEANSHVAAVKAAPTAKILDPKGEIGRAYGATVTPHMYVIDAEGNLAYAGAIDDKPSTRPADIETARPYFREAVEAVKAGETPDPATTRAYGCTIKYSS
ncbi:MAG: redoxin family protein [Alphaproteobacteria bacterium]